MKIRIKFVKTGPVRYVGHLDFMRCFQKIVKKSGLSAVYTSGFNPHMMLSFAAPLGVGEETLGDYADVDFAWRDPCELTEQEKYRLKDIGLDNDSLPDPPGEPEFLRAFNDAAPEGVKAVSAVRVGLIKNSKAMALVRYASFKLVLRDHFLDNYDTDRLESALQAFLSQQEILLHKVSRKSEKEVNIRELIAEAHADRTDLADYRDREGFSRNRMILLTCAQGSSQNLKPASFLEAFTKSVGDTFDPFGFRTVRVDLYDDSMTPLSDLGDKF